MIVVVPPFRFSWVTPTVFRGGHPTPLNYPFLMQTRVRTLISLAPPPLDAGLEVWAKAQGITCVVLDGGALQPVGLQRQPNRAREIISSALQVLVDDAAQPVMVHCMDGTHTTGLVVMALRRLMGWSVASAVIEFARHLTDEITGEESHFIDGLRATIKMP